MKTVEIRERFLNFFKDHQHDIQSSAPIVNKDDPTLMFINAGMNQFKDIFLGNQEPKFTRVANSQKCLRVSGKHNDLEEVGVDTYHHTLFEMLGNWSFGDYYKEEAITMAWDFITKDLGIAKDCLYVTYFEGDKDDNLGPDDETKSIWSKFVAPENILKGNKKDNFWEMGDVGPCGPCTELHVDIRPDAEKQAKPGRDLVNMDHPQVVEIWNLVFIAFNRFTDGSLKVLPRQHVDTGMGLERLAMVLQGKTSTYDTDIFAALIAHLENKSHKKYTGGDSKLDIAFRVISDHIRAVSFAIADGQLPSNTGAGYVIRRILRRAVRYGYSFLEMQDAFLFGMVPTLANEMGSYFPELKAQEKFIVKVIKEEESAFFRTLSSGLGKLENYTAEAGEKVLSGEKAFELYDTFGFPFDLTQLILKEKSWTTSEDDFKACMQQQKDRSKAAAKQEMDDWVIVVDSANETEFVGYDQLSTQSKILRYRKVSAKKKTFFQVVLDKTPFYPEGGGQVGDVGVLQSKEESFKVTGTKKENQLILHILEVLPADLNADFTAVVDKNNREASQKNHSATHLLHLALREVLGTHVEQRGSLVNADYLRFDFSHFEKVSKEELEKVEARVNDLIQENIPLNEYRSIPKAEAEAMGALALFGEKYGDAVRAIKFGPSIELCGGTHVQSTGVIGLVKIVSEASVAAGVRRIEMLSGKSALDWVSNKVGTLDKLEEILGSKKDPVADLEKIVQQKSELQKKVEAFEQAEITSLIKELKGKAEELSNGIRLIRYSGALEAPALKTIAFGLKSEENCAVVLGGKGASKAFLQVALNESLVGRLNAKELIKQTAPFIQGGGGGQDFLASAGGKNPDGISKALDKAKELIESI